MHNKKLLGIVKDRIYLYFYTKNAKNVKLKKNTVAIMAGNKLVYFEGQYGIDKKMLRRLIRLKKNRLRNWKLRFPTEHIGDYFFIDKVKMRFVKNFLKIIHKLLDVKPFPIFELYYKILEKKNKINCKKNSFILLWNSERASIKKLFSFLKLEFKNYLEYKNVFALRMELVYRKKENNLFIDISLKSNRVNFIVCINKNYKKEFRQLKKLFYKKGFDDMANDIKMEEEEDKEWEIIEEVNKEDEKEKDMFNHNAFVIDNIHSAWMKSKKKYYLEERRLFLEKYKRKK